MSEFLRCEICDHHSELTPVLGAGRVTLDRSGKATCDGCKDAIEEVLVDYDKMDEERSEELQDVNKLYAELLPEPIDN